MYLEQKYLFILLISLYGVNCFTSKEAKCLVCKATVAEIEEAISEVDPKKIVEVSGFRIDQSGNSVTKSVQLRRSETYLTELMETICDKMDDYAKATYKTSGKFTILKMVTSAGMNPEMSKVDFVQDGDLNKSLKHYCLEVLDDHEEAATKFFMNENETDIDLKLCGEIAQYCNQSATVEYNLEQDYDEEEDAATHDEF